MAQLQIGLTTSPSHCIKCLDMKIDKDTAKLAQQLIDRLDARDSMPGNKVLDGKITVPPLAFLWFMRVEPKP